MVDSRQKGARVELQIRDILRKYTNLGWERVPMSGALSANHGLKADLYVPNSLNIFAVEVKGYADDHLTSKVLTNTSSPLLEWWDQCKRQAAQISRKPLLIFKYDRSKAFVAYEDIPQYVDHLFVSTQNRMFYVSELDKWILKENPRFV